MCLRRKQTGGPSKINTRTIPAKAQRSKPQWSNIEGTRYQMKGNSAPACADQKAYAAANVMDFYMGPNNYEGPSKRFLETQPEFPKDPLNGPFVNRRWRTCSTARSMRVTGQAKTEIRRQHKEHTVRNYRTVERFSLKPLEYL